MMLAKPLPLYISVPTVSGPVVVAGSFVCECGKMFRR